MNDADAADHIEELARRMEATAAKLFLVAYREGWYDSSVFRGADETIRTAAAKLREMAMHLRKPN